MAVPRFDGQRHDPFRNFNFRIIMGDKEVAACRKMSALDVTVNTVKFRAGNNTSSVDECMPGRVEYKPVTFEAGITNDNTLEDWANQLITHEGTKTKRITDPNFRRTVEIQVLDIDGTMVKKYFLYRAWPSKFTAISDLAGDGNDVLIETLELTHEGFDRVEVSGGQG